MENTMDECTPMILYLENTIGEDHTLPLDPHDDFKSLMEKAKSLLGYEMDLNTLTKNQEVQMTDNVYQFLSKTKEVESTLVDTESYEHLLTVNTNNSNEIVYFLDDGTQIKMNRGTDIDKASENLKVFNIPKSPKEKKSNKDFVDEVPFKNLKNEFGIFECFDQEEPVMSFNIQKSPKSKCFPSESFANSLPFDKVENFGFCKHSFDETNNLAPLEEFNNNSGQMFSSRQVRVNKSDNSTTKDLHRSRVRKSNPSKFIEKTERTQKNPDVFDFLKKNKETTCFLCKNMTGDGKVYIFNTKERDLFVSRKTENVKLLCVECLDKNYTFGRDYNNEILSKKEYLIIRNNKQYVYLMKDIIIDITTPPLSPKEMTNDTDLRSLNMKSISAAINDNIFLNIEGVKKFNTNDGYESLESPEDIENHQVDKNNGMNNKNCLKVESHLEKITIDLDTDVENDEIDRRSLKSEELIIFDVQSNEYLESDDAKSSDIDLIESSDDEASTLGENTPENEQKESKMKCRFCEDSFDSVLSAVEHSVVHCSGEAFPCIFCDYGYNKLAHLRGHLKRKHKRQFKEKPDLTVTSEKTPQISDNKGSDGNVSDSSWHESPIARRTRKKVTDNLIIPLKSDSDKDESESDDNLKVDSRRSSIKNKRIKSQKKNFCVNCGKNYATNQSLFKHKCSKFYPHKKRGRKPKSKFHSDGVENQVEKAETAYGKQPGNVKDVCLQDDLVKPRERGTRREILSDQQLLICDDCNASFSSKVRLNFHMMYHISGRDPSKMTVFRCEKCPNVRLTSESELFDHAHFGHRGPRKYSCSYRGCGKTFYVKAMLTKHARRHTNTRRYRCTVCDKRFLDKQTLDEHSITHLKSKPYECGVCGRRLTRASRLRMHMRAHRSPRQCLLLACVVCMEAFPNAKSAGEHYSISPKCLELAKIKKENVACETLSAEDEEINFFLPPVISSAKNTQGNAKDTQGNERNTQGNEKNTDCNERNTKKNGANTLMVNDTTAKESESLSFAQEAIAIELLAVIEDQPVRDTIKVVLRDKVFRCEYCDLVFCAEEPLREHRKCHDGLDNPFSCQICRASFSTYSRCTTHKTTHGFYKNTIKTEDSKECPRSYLHWTYLQVHRRMKHIPSERELLCDQCDATFHYSWRLKYHRKKFHSGLTVSHPRKTLIDHKIECNECGEYFRNKSALYKHKRREHWGPDIHAQNVGKDELTRKDRLKIHRRFHTGSPEFECTDCDKMFRTRWELRAHAGQKHPYHICVIEVKGLNPSPQQVLEEITLNQLPLDRVMDVAIVSVSSGDENLVPRSYAELNCLMREQKKKPELVEWSKEFMDFISAQQEKLLSESKLREEAAKSQTKSQQEPITAKELAELLSTVNDQILPQQNSDYPNTVMSQENIPFSPTYEQYYPHHYPTENYYYPQYGNLQDFYGNPSNYGNFNECVTYLQQFENSHNESFNYFNLNQEYGNKNNRYEPYNSNLYRRIKCTATNKLKKVAKSNDVCNYGFEEGWFGELSKAATDGNDENSVMIDNERFE